MSIATKDIEQAVLQLPLRERAHLVQMLLDSLDRLSGAEANALWMEEAQRRANEIDQGSVQLVSSEQLENEVQALLK